jgi:hypothetical protein
MPRLTLVGLLRGMFRDSKRPFDHTNQVTCEPFFLLGMQLARQMTKSLTGRASAQDVGSLIEGRHARRMKINQSFGRSFAETDHLVEPI